MGSSILRIILVGSLNWLTLITSLNSSPTCHNVNWIQHINIYFSVGVSTLAFIYALDDVYGQAHRFAMNISGIGIHHAHISGLKVH